MSDMLANRAGALPYFCGEEVVRYKQYQGYHTSSHDHGPRQRLICITDTSLVHPAISPHLVFIPEPKSAGSGQVLV
jgi:hypothetical protein